MKNQGIHNFFNLYIKIVCCNCYNIIIIIFFFDLEIEIYTKHTHTLFGEGKGDSNLYQMGGRDSLAPLGQMPSGQTLLLYELIIDIILIIHQYLVSTIMKKIIILCGCM
jgi:hypothetical protein